jgi:hypothetical protein
MRHAAIGPLHVHGAGGREEARELVQALPIAQPMPGQRIQRAHLAPERGMRVIPLATRRKLADVVIG